MEQKSENYNSVWYIIKEIFFTLLGAVVGLIIFFVMAGFALLCATAIFMQIVQLFI